MASNSYQRGADKTRGLQHYLGTIKGQPNRPNPIKLRKLKKRLSPAKQRTRTSKILVKAAIKRLHAEERATALRMKRIQTGS